VFRFAIVRFDLKTPGREPPEELAAAPIVVAIGPGRAASSSAGRRGEPGLGRRLHHPACG